MVARSCVMGDLAVPNERRRMKDDGHDVVHGLAFLPEKMAAKLLPFQREGVKFAIGKQGRVLIGDEMGLGKTLQALAVAYYYREEWPLLVIVPSSLRYPWIEEVEKWMPEINPSKIKLIASGTDIQDIGLAELCVVTYGLLRHPSCKVVQEALLNQKFSVVIVDESHYIKNRKAATTKFLVPLLKNANRKILLTGTPALARPEELYPQLEALGHTKIFGNWSQYSKRYCDAHAQFFGKTRRWDTSGASNLAELQSNLRDHVMIRRLKRDVLTQLPPKQRQKVPFEVKDSSVKKEMDELWKELHGILGRGQTTINHVFDGSLGTNEDARFRIRCLMGELYRLTAKVKIGPVKEYVKMLCQNAGLKIIVFAHHHIMMDGIQEQLNDDKIKFIRIDGNTNQQERPSLVHQYQTDPETRVAVLSMKAAGVGLTLTAAKLVVFAELDWTPGVLEQCEDRAHRIGQKETVHVHYLVGRWTLDDWVWTALCKKTVVVTATLNGEKQLLQMDYANPGQISWLERADAWVPPPVISDENLRDVFQQAETPNNQKSVLDYFKPKSSSVGSPAGKSPQIKRPKKRKKGPEDAKEHVIDLLDSGDDEDTFRPEQMHLHSERVDMESSYESLPDIRWQRKKSLKGRGASKISDGAVELQTCQETSQEVKIPLTPVQKATSHDVDRDQNGEGNSEQSLWNCQACTFLNNDMLPYCEMCSSPKPRVPRQRRKCRSQKQKDGVLAEEVKQSASEPGDSMSIVETFPKFSQYIKCVNAVVDKGLGQSCDGAANQSAKTVSNGAVLRAESGASDSCLSHQRAGAPSSKKKGVKKLSFQPRRIVLTAERKVADNAITEYESVHFEKKRRKYSQVAMSFMSANSGSSEEEEDGALLVQWAQNENEELVRSLETRKETSVIGEGSAQKHDAVQDVDDALSNTSQMSVELFHDKSVESECAVIEGYDSDSDVADDQKDVTIDDISGDEAGDLPNSSAFPADSSGQSKSDGSGCAVEDNSTKSITSTPVSVKRRFTGADLQAEEAAASALFSPKRSSRGNECEWTCPKCEYVNDASADDCDGCLESRPVQENSGVTDRQVDLDKVQVFSLFQYKCSLNTSRIYLYDEDENPLNLNFIPFDVEMDNFSELPDILLHPVNLRIVKRFVRVWNSISPTKQNIIARSGQVFANPVLLYDQIKSGKKLSSERYTTKLAGAMAAFVAAESSGGSVRVIKRPEIPSKKSKRKNVKDNEDTVSSTSSAGRDGNETRQKSHGTKKDKAHKTLTCVASSSSLASSDDTTQMHQDIEKMKGIVQAVDGDGRPLCVHCQNPYSNDLVSKETVEKNPWITRICSSSCSEQYWISRHREFGKQKLLNLEKGVCQLCKFDAQEFFNRIRTVKDLQKRASLIQESKYSVLTAKIKENMVKTPQSGQFWHMDHIIPVVDGGGECDIDNLRTLCSVCHNEVTKEQNKERRAYRKHVKNAQLGDITAFLQMNCSK